MGIETLEGQSGILRVLVLLLEIGPVHQERLDGPRNLYGRIIKASLEKLESEGLVRRWVDETAWTPRKMSALTAKGMKVAEKIAEIDHLLSSR